MRTWRTVAVIVGSIGLGALVSASLSATAVTAQAGFHECIAGRMYSASRDDIAAGHLPRSTPVPTGWTVVGGGQGGADPVVIMCH